MGGGSIKKLTLYYKRKILLIILILLIGYEHYMTRSKIYPAETGQGLGNRIAKKTSLPVNSCNVSIRA